MLTHLLAVIRIRRSAYIDFCPTSGVLGTAIILVRAEKELC
jgi:hypothetical protein